MNIHNFLVTVVMPVYNGSRFIEESIQSVINQTYKNWELLIIDDCSTDNSIEIIEKYVQDEERIRLFKLKRNSGSPSAPRNFGISKSSGVYTAFLDCDDIWMTSKLMEQVNCAQSYKLNFIFTDYIRLKAKPKYFESKEKVDYKMLLRGNVIGCSSVLIETEIIRNEKFENCGHEDYLFWLRILKRGYSARKIKGPKVFYRVRNDSISANKLKVFRWYIVIYKKLGHSSIVSFLYTIRALLNAIFRNYILSKTYDRLI